MVFNIMVICIMYFAIFKGLWHHQIEELQSVFQILKKEDIGFRIAVCDHCALFNLLIIRL